MTISQPIKIVSGLVMAHGKLLLLQRDNTEGIRDPGRWQLPGGGVEENETPDNAIRRELQEEIGIIPNSLYFLVAPSEDTYVYYAHLVDEEIKNIKKGTEGKDLRFFSFNKLSNIPLTQKLQKVFKGQREILKSLLK